MNTLFKMSLLHYALPHRQVLKMQMRQLNLLEIYIHCPDFVHIIIGVQDLQLKILYILLRLTNVILVWWTYRRKRALKMQCSRKQKRMVVSRHTVLYNVMLEVADQCDVWMQKSVFQQSENTDNCLSPLFASVYQPLRIYRLLCSNRVHGVIVVIWQYNFNHHWCKSANLISFTFVIKICTDCTQKS